MIRIVSFALLVLCVIAQQAHAITIKGQIIAEDGTIPSKVFISSFLNQAVSDTIDVNIYGGFTYELKERNPALFQLKTFRSGFTFFATANNQEVRVFLTVKAGELIAGNVEDYKENEAYNALTKMLQTFDVAIEQAIENKEPDSIFKFILRDFNNELRGFNIFYKGTFAGDTLVQYRFFDWEEMVQKNQYSSLFITSIFKQVNFKDDLLRATPIFSNTIDFFVTALSDYLEAEEKEKQILLLMKQASVSNENYKFIAEKVYSLALTKGKEEVAKAFVKWINSNADSNLIPVLFTKVKRLSASMPGEQFIDVPSIDKYTTKSLPEIVASNKFTLLVFWESTCSHCRNTLPIVKKIYEAFHAKGLEVVAISMDADVLEWQTHLSTLQTTWINTRIEEKNPAINQYYISQMPTLILINKDGVIEKRLTKVEQIGNYLDEKLK